MSTYDNEIDLRPYIQALRKRWWLITIVTVVCAGAAFAYSYFQERNYEAFATILLTRSRASLSLANQFPTITEPIDSRSRMEAMISIAGNEGIAVQTLDDIRQVYPVNEIDLEELKDSVTITSSGDTIQISATINDPKFAAIIANTWAENTVTVINNAYTEEQLPSEILESLKPARMEYELAQSNLESFLKDNQIEILERQIDETSALLDDLVQDRTWKIDYYFLRKHKMEQVINQAENLKALLDSRDSSLTAGLGDALAMLRLRANAFEEIQIDRAASITRSEDNLPNIITNDASFPDMVFNVQMASLIESIESGQDYQRDLDKLIQQAEEEKAKAEAAIKDLTQQPLNAEEDDLFSVTSNRLRNLQSQLEAEEADFTDISNNRDLTLEIYQALIRKEAEVRNNLQTSNTVTLTGPAVPPIEPKSRGLVISTVTGGAIGFLLSTFWIVGAVWMRSMEEVPD